MNKSLKIFITVSILVNISFYFNLILYRNSILDFVHSWKLIISCGQVSFKLIGDLEIPPLPDVSNVMEYVHRENLHVQKGGRFTPRICNSSIVPRSSTAILVPFRDREEHLSVFLRHMHPLLTRQRLEYKIYVIVQEGNNPFNRGKLLNIGFVEAMNEKNWSCIIFHDVDYLPLNDENMYTCWDNPREMVAAGSVWNYVYGAPYKNFFGAVSSIKPHQFREVNGFYNDYYGWGAEDDDLSRRIQFHHMKIDILDQKTGSRIGRYKMMDHENQKKSPKRFELLMKTKENMRKNGLNNLKYQITAIRHEPLYMNITVNVFYNESTVNKNKDNQ
ncbi:beta-1,4-galactosyltransferase 3 [Lepeophtheirus salmonis]|uniref:beta-1,4-galactosyltransferase 3 n=1 Tax=Lepeophtheirus salmonis TaxID=72036 RepID=UPI001AE125A9|nr:beta-1,4-galactosyltransferase 3-like [Lepeophtheirus salmonis]